MNRLSWVAVRNGGWSIVILTAFLVFAFCPPSRAQDAKKPVSRVVLVPPFENNSKVKQKVAYDVGVGNNLIGRTFMVDRLSEAPRSMLENTISNIKGVTVVERKALDKMLVETEYGAMSGLVDEEKAVKLGKQLGAHLMVMGTITDIREETRQFKGYKIATEQTVVICTIIIRLIDIEQGAQAFSKKYQETKTYTKSNFGKSDSSDRAYAAVEVTLDAVAKDDEFKAALLGKDLGAEGTGQIEVEFAPKPENCDIEVDGNYVGGSPMKRSLPAQKQVKIRISKDGFKSWEGVIVPEKGLRITRELGPEK